jgi:hypothetical protein
MEGCVNMIALEIAATAFVKNRPVHPKSSWPINIS